MLLKTISLGELLFGRRERVSFSLLVGKRPAPLFLREAIEAGTF